MKPPERLDLDLDQAEALLQRTKEALCPADYNTIKAMAETIYLLSQSVDQKAASIRRPHILTSNPLLAILAFRKLLRRS